MAKVTVENLSISAARAKHTVQVNSVVLAVESMHKEIFGLTSHTREKKVKVHNAKTNVQALQF